MTRAKYRPYFSLSELQKIREVFQSHAPTESGIIKYLHRYIRDIEDGIREPNHINLPTVEEKLGFSPEQSNPVVEKSAHILYQAWQNNVPLSPAQIRIVLEYKYSNDLMTPEEEAAFEISLMNPSLEKS